MHNPFTKLYSNKSFLVLETIFLFIIPLVILKVHPSLYRFRTIAMIIALPYLVFVMKTVGISQKKLGLSLRNFLQSMRSLILPTILCIFIIFITFRYFPSIFDIHTLNSMRNILSITNPFLHVVFTYLIVSAPLQELLFRAFLTSRLELVSQNKYFLIAYTSLIFMFIHLPLQNFFITIGALLLGILWEINFIKYRNIVSISLSHALIGGFFVYNLLLIQ